MSSERRLVASLEDYIRQRDADSGSRSGRHVAPVVRFVTAELVQRGIPKQAMAEKERLGHFFMRPVDLIVRRGGKICGAVLVWTQSGSIKNNLNNRKRDIVGDVTNLRAALPGAKLGLVFLMRADAAATQRNKRGTRPVDDLAGFLRQLQRPLAQGGWGLVDMAILIAADREPTGKVRIEDVPAEVNPLGDAFARFARAATSGGVLRAAEGE